MSKIIFLDDYRAEKHCGEKIENNNLREWARVLEYRERRETDRADSEALAGIAVLALALWAILILIS